MATLIAVVAITARVAITSAVSSGAIAGMGESARVHQMQAQAATPAVCSSSSMPCPPNGPARARAQAEPREVTQWLARLGSGRRIPCLVLGSICYGGRRL